MNRRRLTKLQRVRIFDRAKGVCGQCGLKIHAERGERWDVDHEKPLHMKGTDDESNMVPVHRFCHERKCAAENEIRAKTDRLRARHLGIAGPGRGRNAMPCGRRSKWKRKLDGSVVARSPRP